MGKMLWQCIYNSDHKHGQTEIHNLGSATYCDTVQVS